ncbi:MAG: thiamine pyrophosphate-binding protein [Rhodocyclaceae bacterium]|nr:thiamine pyrophosphate-binding protein [Rhodocyclaceae bacterium]
MNLQWADALVEGLILAGLRHVVIAPGARSTPLVFACLRRSELTATTINDERAAGFFALGLAKATGIPAAIICTSGTATANLLPAIVEANLASVPLLALTADRPLGAVGWGGNQTIDQIKLYGSHVRSFHDVDMSHVDICHRLAARLMQESTSPRPGPVHLNIHIGEPLLSEATTGIRPDFYMEEQIARCFLEALPKGWQCFIGNSLAFRAAQTAGEGRFFYSNRGASGIDGNIATAAGIYTATGQPVALLIGDQTALHDGTSLSLLSGKKAVVVVIDNGGGRIFDHLPIAPLIPPLLFKQGWTAPSTVDFASLAHAFHLQYAEATDTDRLKQHLGKACASGDAWLISASLL